MHISEVDPYGSNLGPAQHAVTLNGRAWVIGGFDGNARQDVWSTADGVNWSEATATAGFTPRFDLPAGSFNNQVVVLGNNLWLIGGGSLREVWSSTDGTTWTQINAGASFPVRSWFQALAFNNRLWVIGGINGSRYNDVWSSSDGVTWTMATAAAAFSARFQHTAVVFNGKMWVIGGDDINSLKNDVWSSTDGVTWIQASAAAPFTPRTQTQAVVLNNQLCIVAGNDDTRTHDMWCSPDGTQWRLAVGATLHY